MMKKNMRQLLNRLRRDDGSQLLELVLVLPILMTLLAGSVDFGRLWFLNMEVTSAAEAGALYGLQNPTDTAGMQAAAQLDAPDISGLSSSATYGTECSDGTSAVALNGTPAACGVTVVKYVEVDTTLTYQPILYYPGFQSAFSLTGKSRMRATFE